MLSTALLVLVLILSPALSLQAAPSTDRCGVDPQFQCLDFQTAQDCGALERCFPGGLGGLEAEAADPVELALYYESLCPYCRAFILTELWGAFQTFPPSVLNLTLIPHGNAQEIKVGDRYLTWCEHGRSECVGNVIASCVIEELEAVSVYFPLIHCMEAASSGSWYNVTEQCGQSLNISTDGILACAQGPEGQALQHQNALRTQSLVPSHRYVPWITVNGNWSEDMSSEARKDLVSFICKTYTGPTPDACKTHTAKPPSIVG